MADSKPARVKRAKNRPLKVQLTRKSEITATDMQAVLKVLEGSMGPLSSIEFSTTTQASNTGDCGSHTCSGAHDNPPEQPDCPGLGFCDTETCEGQSCSGHACDTNSCDTHACRDENFDCVEHSSKLFESAFGQAGTSSWPAIVEQLQQLDWVGVSVQTESSVGFRGLESK